MVTTPSDDLITDYLTHLQVARRRAPKTLKTYGSILRQADRQLPSGLAGAHRLELQAWLARCRTASTQQLRTVAIRGFMRWATDEIDELDFDPTVRIELPRKPRKVPKPATTQQVDTILARAPDPVWLWALLASHAGLRCIEISRLHRRDVDEQQIYVVGKGDHERIVPTHEAIWQAVRDLDDEPITHLSGDDISNRGWAVIRRDLGLRTSMHPLRGWFATSLWDSGVDLETIRRLLGHASLATTQAYLGLSPTRMRAAVSALPTIAGAAGARRQPAAA